MKVQLQPMSEEQAEAVLALDHQAFSPQARFTVRQFRALLDDPEVSVFVVVDEESKILGACIIKIRRLPKEVRLISLLVEEAYRSIGIGDMMLQAVIALARSMEMNEIVLQVSNDNNDNRLLFEKAGFETVKELPVFLFEGNAGVEMKLVLKQEQGIKVFQSNQSDTP